MKANLSRIHSLISQAASDTRRLMEEAAKPMEANGPDFIMPVLESTTDEDIKGFLYRLGGKKAQIKEALQKCRALLEYSFYLRDKLDEANRASGVAVKLLELNNIKKKLAHLYKVRQIISMSCSQGLQPLKSADYYKASFTDKLRVYDLALKMFAEDDYSAIQHEINEAERASFSVSNEIAFINQTTTLEILDFEEFQCQ